MDEDPGRDNRDDAEDADPAAELLNRLTEAVEAGREVDAEQALAGFLEEVARFTEEHANDPHMLLLGKADDLAQAGDFAGAEAAWREALETSESDAHAILPCQRLTDLYLWLDRHDEALAVARDARQRAARSDITTLSAMTAEMEAHCLLDLDRYQEAIAAADEAVPFLMEGAMGDPVRARLITFRARCAAAMGDWERAERELSEAWEIMQRPGTGAFGAPNLVLAHWWAVTARLRSARGDREGAVAAWEESVQRRKDSLVMMMDPGTILREMRRKGLSDAYQSLGEARQALGDLPGAEEAYLYSRSIASTLIRPAQ